MKFFKVVLFFSTCLYLSNCFINNPSESVSKNSIDYSIVNFNDKEFVVCSINPDEMELKVVSNVETGINRIEMLGDSLYKEGKQLLFATNGGIFSKGHIPGGLYINDGKEINSINTRKGAGNFHLMPNGVFYLDKEGEGFVRETHEFNNNKPTNIHLAIQSGPMLVIDNELHPAFNDGSNNTYVRNGVGVNDEGELIFAISKNRVNLFTFASLFKDELECKNALYLDGAISEMYIHQLSKEHDIKRKFATIFYLEKDLE